MPFNKPTLKELIKVIESDLYSRFSNDTKPSMYSIIKVIAAVLSGLSYMIYCTIEWAIRQIFPDKAEEEYFSKWAYLFNVQRKKPEYSRGTAIFKGTKGAKVPLYTKIQTNNGFIFQTIKEGIIVESQIEIDIYAMKPGASGNLKEYTFLSLVNPIVDIDGQVQVGVNGTYNGTDLEDFESWRRRFFLRLRNPPSAGNENDYINWALEIAGVTRAWCYPCFPNKGIVGLTCVKDNDINIFPNREEIETYRKYILSKMPITAELNLFTLLPLKIDFEIQLRNNNDVNKAKITNILKNVITENSSPNKTIKIYQFIVSIQSNDFSINDFNIVSPKIDLITTNMQIHFFNSVQFKDLA